MNFPFPTNSTDEKFVGLPSQVLLGWWECFFFVSSPFKLLFQANIEPPAHVTVERVYTPDISFPVTAGLSDLHTSVMALERLNVISNSSSSATSSNTATIQDTGINMMITGSTNSLLTDPNFVINVAPINCTSSDCKSLFLPGGMELVRYQNGSAINITSAPEDSILIVNNAPGFQVEYEPSDYVFNYSADCTMYGYAVSSFFSCLKFTGTNIISGE
jgi:hypothetical protein